MELVRSLHTAPHQAVLEVAGAGTQAVVWLHGVGRSSRTVLEATDRYSTASLGSLLGTAPAKTVTRKVAAAMAKAARRRAGELAAPGVPVVGAACTAAIATDRPRRGAHRAVVAAADRLGVTVCDLRLSKGALSRGQEEAAASYLLLEALAGACGVCAAPEQPAAPDGKPAAGAGTLEHAGLCALLGLATVPATLRTRFRPARVFAALVRGEADWLLLDAAGAEPSAHRAGEGSWERRAVISGAFNPLHAGHLALRAAAAAYLERETLFELPLRNADKAPLHAGAAQRRAAQFAGVADLVLSRAPLFLGKAELYPGAVFVVGVDTALRLVDPRFYGGSRSAMEQGIAGLARRDCRFLVAGRRIGRRYTRLADLDLGLPAGLRGLFRELPQDVFRVDLSSSEIRARRARGESG